MQQDLQELFVNQYNSLHLNKSLPNCASGRGGISLERSAREHIMRASIRSSTLSCITGAAAALWLFCAAQPAQAGGGSGDLAGVQTEIDAFCSFFVANCHIPMPTLSQAVLELAGLSVLSPDTVRSGFDVPVENYVHASNPSRPPAVPCIGTNGNPCVDPLNPFTLPVDASVLSTLHPIAFTSAMTGTNTTSTATPAQLFDSEANIFVYAVVALSANGAIKNSSQADSLLIFYDDTSRINAPTAAKIGLPLTVLNTDGTERFVPAVLNYVPSAGNDCSASTVTGDFAGTGTTSITAPNNIGVGCAVVLATSPASPKTKHAIIEVTASLLVTKSNDPVIFGNGGFKPAFTSDVPGAPSANCPGQRCILGYTPKTKIGGMSIGVAPSAGPLGPPQSCTGANCVPPAAKYSLCASLQTDASGTTLLPSVAGFSAIAGSGEVFLSATLNPSGPIVCPF
jgi:hypothetical protein